MQDNPIVHTLASYKHKDQRVREREKKQSVCIMSSEWLQAIFMFCVCEGGFLLVGVPLSLPTTHSLSFFLSLSHTHSLQESKYLVSECEASHGSKF